MRDLPRVVAESPVGKAVDVVIVRDGKEVSTVKVTLGRLEDGENLAEAEAAKSSETGEGTDQDRSRRPQNCPRLTWFSA